MKIVLYNNTAEKNRVDKTLFITDPIEYTGTLREECSITNPVIELQHVGLITANYAYIEEFKRYYYINEIVSVRNNLWRIYMSVDVLMTYRLDINRQKAYVTRSAYIRPTMYDPELPLRSEVLEFRAIEAPTSLFSLNTGNVVYYIVVGQNNVLQTVTNPDWFPYVFPNSKVSPLCTNIMVYLFDDIQVFHYYYKTWASSTEASGFIMNVGILPMGFSDFTVLNTVDVLAGYLYIGNTRTALRSGDSTHIRMCEPNSTLNKILTWHEEDFKDLNWKNLFNDKAVFYNQNTKMSLFLPLYGFVDLPKKIFSYPLFQITFGCTIDFTNMQISYNVNYAVGETIQSLQIFLLGSYATQLGIPTAINRVNANEVEARSKANVLNYMSNVIGNVGTIIGGAMSMNPNALLQGGVGMITAPMEYAANEAVNIPTGNTAFSDIGAYQSAALGDRPYINCSYIPSAVDRTEFNELHGSRVKVVTQLGSLEGFTQIGDIHFDGIYGELLSEIELIIKQLKEGVIM